MKEKVTVLRALQSFGGVGYTRVGKYIYKDGKKQIYQNPINWEVFEHEVTDLNDFHVLLQEVSSTKDSILIRGVFEGGNHLACRRTKQNFRSVHKCITMMDIDHLDVPDGVRSDTAQAVEYAISRLPQEFQDADCIAQFSSSAGLSGRKIKLHLFFWLEEAQPDGKLKKWAKSINHLIDPSLYNSVQPHYISDPSFEDPTQDPFQLRSRISFIKKKRRSVPVSFLNEIRIPTPSKKTKEEVGILKYQRLEPADLESPNGKLIDGRENHLLNIRFKLMNRGYENLDQFTKDVWNEFRIDCELGTTQHSETSWDFGMVSEKCEQDRHKLPSFVGPKITWEREYLSREDAQKQLKSTVREFINVPHNLLIRAEAGLGKSSAVQSILADWPSIANMTIEIYTPTKKLAREWEGNLLSKNSALDVRVSEGRSEDNCFKWPLAKEIGALGGGVSHHMCHNKSSNCEHWGKCGFSTQNENDKPAIRIMTHSHLKLGRPANLPTPDFVVIDEGFLNEQIASEAIKPDRLASRRGYKMNLGGKTFLGPTVGSAIETPITRGDLDTTIRVGGMIVEALEYQIPLLAHLRSNEVCPILLRRCAKTISSFMKTPFISPADNPSRQKSALSRAKYDQVADIRKMNALYENLAVEVETNRAHSRVVNLRKDEVEIRYRQALPRIDGIPTLILDADGELEIVKKSIPDIIEKRFPVRYNADVWQVSDKSFSKSALIGDVVDDGSDLGEEVGRFLNEIPEPSLTLVLTYKAYQEGLTGTSEGFSEMANGMTVGHFGNIRGTDDFKDFTTVVVIGRNMPPREVIGLLADALEFDIQQDTPSSLASAVYRSKITSETNQSVARLRMVWTDAPKTVYLLSSEQVPFPVDNNVTWHQLLENKCRPYQLLKRFQVIPLVPKWLVKNASDLFITETSARKWIENSFPIGTEDGRFRLEGQSGRHKRFIAHDQALDPISILNTLCGPLSAYEGPQLGLWMDGRIWRHAYDKPSCRGLYDTSAFGGPALPTLR